MDMKHSEDIIKRTTCYMIDKFIFHGKKVSKNSILDIKVI